MSSIPLKRTNKIKMRKLLKILLNLTRISSFIPKLLIMLKTWLIEFKYASNFVTRV